ncbi:hypothetical protein AB1N83_013600 [Pleurotus pulmonarius]
MHSRDESSSSIPPNSSKTRRNKEYTSRRPKAAGLRRFIHFGDKNGTNPWSDFHTSRSSMSITFVVLVNTFERDDLFTKSCLEFQSQIWNGFESEWRQRKREEKYPARDIRRSRARDMKQERVYHCPANADNMITVPVLSCTTAPQYS